MTPTPRPSLAVSALVLVVAFGLGALAVRTAATGFAASLPLGAQQVTTFTGPAAGDLAPPRLTLLEMYDWDLNGRVDRVVATFHKTLAAPYTAGTAGWTLTDAPSGATVASVSISGPWATLDLTEGTGAPATDVGAFTVALAATEGGVRDSDGRLASFAATAPVDRARPVPLAVDTTIAGTTPGQLEAGDAITITFSEPLAASSIPATTTVTEQDAAGADRTDFIDIPGVTTGAVSTGGTNYIAKNGASATADATVELSADGRALVVTVGACTCSDARAGDGAFTYAPPATITDPAGNTAAGSVTTSTTFRLF